MKRLRIVVPLAVLVLAACQDVQQPPVSFDVSDGSEFGGFGNPHFFFMPPLVPSPEFSGTFDGGLLSILRVEVIGPFADEGLATCDGPVHDVLDEARGLRVDPVGEQYGIPWQDNGLEEHQVYRLCVHLQPAPTVDAVLGFRDVEPAQGGGSVSEAPVYRFNNGSTLPIRFRVEEGVLSFELCTGGVLGGNYDCTAQVLDNAETAICDNATCALSTPEDGLAQPTLFLIEREACTVDGSGFSNWLAVDIPQYGGCMRVTVFDPAWEGFLNDELAIVATCPDLSTGPPLVSPVQDESMQLHLQRAIGDVEALPPRFSAIDGDCVDPNPEPAGGGLAARLERVVKHGWGSVRRTVTGLLGATPAHAFHSGFGGHTRLAPTGPAGDALMAGGEAGSASSVAPSLSVVGVNEASIEFLMAWAIPSQMEAVTPLGTVIGNVGDVVPVQVLVTDNGRTTTADEGPPRPVQGATVRFAVVNPGGLVTPGEAVTDGDGNATVDWTLQPGGSLVLEASGFGIGVRPAAGFGGFDALGNDPVQLGTGVLTFNAIACDASVPGITTATVDGRIDALDDYSDADTYAIPVSLGGNNSSTATVYVGNDCDNLYVAFAVGTGESNNNSLRFVFDNVFGNGESADDDILSIGRVGSGWLFRDRYLSADCLGSKQANCGPDDPGMPDGAGAASWNPNLTIGSRTGFFVYEMSHPLASGDAAHDFQTNFGSRVGFYLAVSLGSGSKGNTEWPDQRGRFKTYQEYLVKGPAVP